MNRKVYWLACFLVLLSAASIAAKVIYGGQIVAPDYGSHLWRVDIVMNLIGKGARAKVRLTLPKGNDRQRIYNEHFENDNLIFYIRERVITGNRLGFWRSELLDGSKSIQHTFSAQLKSRVYDMPVGLMLPKKPRTAYPPEIHIEWLDSSKFIQSAALRPHVKKVIGREKRIHWVMRRIYDFVRGQVRYESEKGSKDARETLKKLEADCGGKARLFVAFSRAAGIPSRIVGGLILSGGQKQTTHVWAENYLGGQWIPFDVVNDNYASIPNHYLELYRGDYFLVKHIGVEKFEYFFVINPEKVPPVDNPWSLYVLPLHFQNLVKVLLLIPVGTVVVSFCRTVIGVPTFGTFAPVLLALSFEEVSVSTGLACLGGIIFFGCLLRKVLDLLRILVIPRLSIIVTMVVIFVLAMMVVGFHYGNQKILYITLFPLIIMTWTIERFSVIQIEDGTQSAIKTSLGTAFVAIATYYVIGLRSLRTYLFAFPELLFSIMAILLVMGRYTGIRLTEIWRFRELTKIRERNL